VGLAQDPELDMLYRYLLLSPLPLSFHDPAFPLPPTTRAIQHVGFDQSGDEHLPGWVEDLAGLPTVYATLGTISNRFTPILQAILDGLRGEPVNLILTVGRDRDPAEFEVDPGDGRVHVERYIPQSLLLPHCDLVVSHAGSGTVKDTLSLGLPMVLIPIGADQPVNARRCEALGVARVIGPDSRTPEAIREAVKAVLGDPSYRQQAHAVRHEMLSLPGLDYAVGLLEGLAKANE
jgi:MGT family glycosyltransferase